MVRLDLREIYLGRVRERERRSSGVDSRSEDAVVEGCVESGFVGVMVGWLECSVVVVEDEELRGSGSVAVSVEIVPSVEAIVDGSEVCVHGVRRGRKQYDEVKMMKELPAEGGRGEVEVVLKVEDEKLRSRADGCR